jgi:phage shock protein PspC (stress-responsive transcriptional regulator)
MKKVININFQGQVIAIEETAYEILRQYIESLQRYFSREEGGDEIVNDIECRIAELFGNRLKHGISCITDEDVETVISSIGHPKDFDTEYEEPVKPSDSYATTEGRTEEHAGDRSEEAPYRDREERRSLYRNASDKIIGGVCSGIAHYFKADPIWIRLLFVLFFAALFWVYIVMWIVLKQVPLETNVSKRLYRNPNDRMLGGVCGGIAAYFKIDSWIPRLLFLLPLMLNLIGMMSFFPLNRIFDDMHFNWNFNMSLTVVYIVLWIIIPEARTVKQKLEMMGENEYIRSIREKVSDNVSGTRNRPESNKQDTSLHAMPPEPPVTPRQPITPHSDPRDYAVNQQAQRSGCLNAIIILLKIIFFTFVGFFALMLVGVLIAVLFASAQFMSLKSLFIDPGYETTLLILSLSLMVLIPVISIITWIIRRVMKAKSRPAIGIVAFVLWFGGITLAAVLTKSVTDKFVTESSKETIVSLEPVRSDRLFIDMLPYPEDYAEFKIGFGWDNELDDLPYTSVNGDSLLFRDINIYVKKSNDSLFHVRTIAATNGKDLRSAKNDISEFTYNLQQQDSLLLLPEFLSVPIRQGYREQSITVEIAVPAGKTVEISDALNDYKNNEPPTVVRKRIRGYTRTNFHEQIEITEGKRVTVVTYDAL